ncbi:MAG: adenylyltransferase/cytidyltransferase family protein, partial [Cyanobacteria bacterium]|nr:adenylyltransferase/cytidyltransferase family protein [Cyanobacteriota bacterium]
MMFTVKRLTTSPPPGAQYPAQYSISPPFGMFEKHTANYSRAANDKFLPLNQPALNLLFEAARKKKKTAQTAQKKSVPQKSAIVAASWDPPTLGHVWLVKKAAQFFDKVWVVLAANPDKTSSFTQDDRLEMIHGSLSDVPNTEVVTLQNEFLVEFAKKKKASALVRGIRNT